MKVYLAGPMTGIENFNYPHFNEIAKELRALGHEVLNPTMEEEVPSEPIQPWDFYLRRAIGMVIQCEAVVLLKGWQQSKGAMLEVSIANALDMPTMEWVYER